MPAAPAAARRVGVPAPPPTRERACTTAHTQASRPAPLHAPQLNNGGKGANLNVFVEASIAWQKRQSALVAKAQAAQGWGSMFTSPAAGSSMQDAARAAAEGGGASSALGRGINAASVAAAARRWRDYQRAKRTREQRLLTVSSSASVDASVDAALQSSDV